MFLRLRLLKMVNRLISGLYIVLALALTLSCGQNRSKGQASAVVEKVEFPTVEVPGMITDPAERLDYILTHFWDGLMSTSVKGVSDSLHVVGFSRDDVEKQFGMYATLLWQAPVSEGAASVKNLFNAAEACEKRDTTSNVFETITSFAEKYFYDPNSPLRNEEFYLPYLEGLVASDMVPEVRKYGYAYDAKMCSLNRIGTIAADFEFRTTNGRSMTLHNIKADYILLFFSNPGCPNCKEITDMLESSPEVHELETSGRLKVVSVYIDKEIDKWKAYASEYPEEWICGYDDKYVIRTDVTYSVRAIPSLYLLDKDKKVMMKDAPQDKIFEALSYLAQNSGQ